jgi:ferredoxin-NADP reductase
MAAERSRLVRRESVAEGTMAFFLERPAGFAFQAGQSLNLALAEGETRTFTIASAPHEPELMVATRMREGSRFKSRLAEMPPGTPLSVDGPNGIMVLHEDAALPAVFLAGGIGITPFLSMTRDAAHRRLPHRITLFYSNRRPEDAAFLDELARLGKAHPAFRLVPTMTGAAHAARPWSGETQLIGERLLRRHLDGVKGPVYYLAGPPGMTMAVQGTLMELGVPAESIRSEEFYGY